MDSKIDMLQNTVNRNYDLLEEFYVNQREFNVDMKDRMQVIEGKVEMHGNQIARNTAEIREIKSYKMAAGSEG